MKIRLRTTLWISIAFILLLSAMPGIAAQRVSDADRRAISPEIAVGADGAINVIWLDKGLTADRPAPKPRKPGEHSHRSATDLYFSRSEDNGASWSRLYRLMAGTPFPHPRNWRRRTAHRPIRPPTLPPTGLYLSSGNRKMNRCS